MLGLFEGLRDDTDAEQRLPECVQKFNLPFGVLFEPFGDIADQIAEHSCDLGPCHIAICNVDAEIGQVAIGATSGSLKKLRRHVQQIRREQAASAALARCPDRRCDC